ncbi:L-fucose:H+ symporter permease [Granulicella sp. 5B5]|uniref:L-fucose:H+ symporter permease n=1 Tax=Granulicella sp. 5B5 TaxID=1617967 RepID=UPI0015F45198|nr:L-fucose:H+ symporter permease [Granulicella sp. 5B5]QMV18353.1 L-fucose:H+ symporter permease [Granulicella sp. 5B5]
MLAFLLTTIVFFVWGMSNNLTDILVQQFKKSFELSLLQAQLVQTANFFAYFVMATPAALLSRRFGYKVALVVGLVTFGVGTLLFWPAAVIGQYTPFLIAIFIVGTGASILETSANPLIAQFGDPETSEQRLNFAQAFNPPGTIVGVIVGTLFIFSGVEKSPVQVAAMKAQGTYAAYLHSEILRVVPTYVAIGAVVLVLALLLSRAEFPQSLDSNELAGYPSQVSQPHKGAYGRLFRNGRLMFAVVAQFFYVGAQVGVWSTLIPYLKAYTTVGDRPAGYFLTATLVAFAAGRVISTPLMRYVSPAKMVGVYALINVLLLVGVVAHPGMSGAIAILVVSLFMSVMYPTIFALGVKGLGDDTKLAGSLLVMAILGGAIFPPAMGWISRLSGSVALGYLLPAAAFMVVALFSFLVPRLTDLTVSRHSVEIAPQSL